MAQFNSCSVFFSLDALKSIGVWRAHMGNICLGKEFSDIITRIFFHCYVLLELAGFILGDQFNFYLLWRILRCIRKIKFSSQSRNKDKKNLSCTFRVMCHFFSFDWLIILGPYFLKVYFKLSGNIFFVSYLSQRELIYKWCSLETL